MDVPERSHWAPPPDTSKLCGTGAGAQISWRTAHPGFDLFLPTPSVRPSQRPPELAPRTNPKRAATAAGVCNDTAITL